jgi:hypothetical protein
MIAPAGLVLALHLIADGTGATADELALELLIFASVVCVWSGTSRLRGKGFPRMPRVVAWGLVGLAPVLLVGAIVLPPKLRPQIAKIRPRSSARLEIASPTPNQSVSGELMAVRLDLIGGTITSTTSTNLTPNTGHIHLSVDGSLVSMTYGTVQRVAIGDLASGPHVLKAEFVAADHGPFNPPVTASVTFVKQR